MRTSLAAITAAVLLAVAACDGGPAPRDAAEDPRSEAALRYGLPPAPQPGVTLQPDVVIVSGGGRTIKSVTADGLTWRLDGRAGRVDELAPGKVMFVTGRAVGRVLDVRRDGGDVLVTVGPVDLTEVIRDGTFEKTGITLDSPVTYPAGDPFWANPDGPADSGGGARLGRAAPVVPPVPPIRPVQPPPLRTGEIETRVNGQPAFASCCTDGVGVHYAYRDGGTKLFGTVTLTFRKPQATFHLDIRGSAVRRADLEISGGFGSRIDFEAGTDSGRNITAEFPVPAEFTFPIAQVLGVPITFSISQALVVKTAFGAKLGTVKGSGEFTLAGSLGYGYADGSFGPHVTGGFTRKKSLINSLTGVPVGVMGLVIEHRVKFNVGFNAFVLAAGVYFELSTSYGMTLGSALGAAYAQCRGVALGVRVGYGVGYQILEPVVRQINRFLALLDITPIRSRHGIGSTLQLYSKQEVIPDAPICRKASA